MDAKRFSPLILVLSLSWPLLMPAAAAMDAQQTGPFQQAPVPAKEELLDCADPAGRVDGVFSGLDESTRYVNLLQGPEEQIDYPRPEGLDICPEQLSVSAGGNTSEAGMPMGAGLTAPAGSVEASVLPGSGPRHGEGWLVFATTAGGDLFTVKADGSGLSLVGRGMDPAISPDGGRIAFVSWEYPEGIYVMNGDGSGRTLVLEATEVRAPAWSPDGSRIAFFQKYSGFYARRNHEARMEVVKEDLFKILELDLATGRVSSRPGDPHSYSPTWSADGNLVAFHGEKGIFLAATDGEPLLLAGTDTRFASPAWSPDGTQISYMWRQHDHWEIGVMASDGSGQRLLTSAPPFADRAANNVAPAWSPDSRRIAFLSDRDGTWNLYIMDADGNGSQQRLLDMPLDYQFARERATSWGK